MRLRDSFASLVASWFAAAFALAVAGCATPGPEDIAVESRPEEVEAASLATEESELLVCTPEGFLCLPVLLPCCGDNVCHYGICKAPPEPPDKCKGVTCTPIDDCHDAGVCDPKTGECSNPIKEDGSQC